MEKQTQDVKQGESKTPGLGLGLGVDVGLNLDLSGVQTLVNDLNHALSQTGGVATDLVANVIRTVNQLGVQNLVKWAREGGREAKELYNQLVSKLQEAASRGEDQARSLLGKMGEKVEGAGEKMQSAASEDVGATH